MGKIWGFFNQDAGAGLDRLLKPYADFTRSHPLLDALITVVAISAVWILVSKTLAVFLIGLWVLSMIPALVVALLKQRRGL